MTRSKKILYSILGVLIIITLIVMSILMVVREEFKNHLKQAHPERTFSVKLFVLYDPIYEKYVTHATCLEDYTEFTIYKSINSKVIMENYLNQKNQNDYNGLLDDIFQESIMGKHIKAVTGGGKIPLDSEKRYQQINFYLPETVNHPQVIKDSLLLLKNNSITCTNIIYSYEKIRAAYTFNVSSDNYDITEEEIEKKIVKIKGF